MKDNERQEIEKFGQLQENGIFTMTIIGEIEGHQLSAQNAKTTKYEHMIPALAKVEPVSYTHLTLPTNSRV